MDINNVEKLEHDIKRYAQLYYEGNPEISDEDFDKLVIALMALKPSSEVLKTGWGYNTNNSPLEKRNHLYGKLEGIGRKYRPDTVPEKFTRFATCKLDGASVALYYNDGKLDFALSRGDGEVGLDVTDKMIPLVPVYLTEKFTGRVRGEFILPRDVFDSKYKDRGMKSPRNASSGILTSKNWDIKDLMDFMFIAYTVTENGRNLTQAESLNRLSKLGIKKVNNVSIMFNQYNNEELEHLLTENNKMYGHVFDCDGFVCNDGDGLFAIKWNIDTAESTVTNIRWQQSRLGKLTPVVEIEPVELQDATIKNVSGFNAKYIRDNNIGKGSVVSITRSGDIIPYIVDVVSEVEPEVPDVCPICGSVLVEDGVDIVCKNPSCSGVITNNLINFLLTVAPVDGIGDTILRKYINFFNITNVIELKMVTSGTSIKLFVEKTDGLGLSAYKKLREMMLKLNDSIPADTFLCGLGLKGLGSNYCHKLFNKFTVKEFCDIVDARDIDKLSMLNVTGRKSISENRVYILCAFHDYDVESIAKEDNSVQLKIPVCITGKLSVSRKDFLSQISSVGAYEVPIAKAEILITDNPNGTSSKNKYANEHNIKKLSEEEFRNMYMR